MRSSSWRNGTTWRATVIPSATPPAFFLDPPAWGAALRRAEAILAIGFPASPAPLIGPLEISAGHRHRLLRQGGGSNPKRDREFGDAGTKTR